MFPWPPDSLTGPPDTIPRPPDTFPEPPDTFPGYNGPISFEANNDDLALLVVHYLKHCNQLSRYMFPRLPDLLTHFQELLTRVTDHLTRFLVI